MPETLGDGITLHHGDCLDVLRGLPDNSVDSCVTDPPYGLADLKPKVVIEALTAWLGGDRAFVPSGPGGFMGRAWDRFVPPPAAWDECYRVLKPGGWLLAFAAPRTADLMGLSIRLAGFSLTDSLHWVSGQGFPKAKSRLKPAHEPVIMARKPARADSPLPGLDACRVGIDTTREGQNFRRAGNDYASNHTQVERRILGEDKAERGGYYSDGGRWPPNLLLVHDARCQPAGTRRVKSAGDRGTATKAVGGILNHTGERLPTGGTGYADADGLETVQAWECADSCPVTGLDAQSEGTRAAKPSKSGSTSNPWCGEIYGAGKNVPDSYETRSFSDSGGAARFFPQFSWDPEYDLPFMYCAKAPKSERPAVEGVQPHCAVKPLAVMKWLARLVTPPGGTILDPFAGTGTTGQAAALEGFRAILIEQDPGAIKQIRVRMSVPMQAELHFPGG